MGSKGIANDERMNSSGVQKLIRLGLTKGEIYELVELSEISDYDIQKIADKIADSEMTDKYNRLQGKHNYDLYKLDFVLQAMPFLTNRKITSIVAQDFMLQCNSFLGNVASPAPDAEVLSGTVYVGDLSINRQNSDLTIEDASMSVDMNIVRVDGIVKAASFKTALAASVAGLWLPDFINPKHFVFTYLNIAYASCAVAPSNTLVGSFKGFRVTLG